MTSKFTMFKVPQDHNLLAALGEITLLHEYLNHNLKMTIKSIVGLRAEEALDATQYQGSRTLRDRIIKLASQKLKEGEPLLKLQALMTRAGRLTEQRNKLTHRLWAKEHNGDSGIMSELGELLPLPSVEELNSLAENLKILTNELYDARIEGFLIIALKKRN